MKIVKVTKESVNGKKVEYELRGNYLPDFGDNDNLFTTLPEWEMKQLQEQLKNYEL